MRRSVRRWRLHFRSDLDLEAIAKWVRPVLSGWVRYYGRFYPSKLRDELRTIDAFIVRWAARKYKRFRGHTKATWKWLSSLRRRTCSPTGPSELRLDDASRMNREVHVRFWESAGLRCPAPLTYLRAYDTVAEARTSLARYFSFYNSRRPHSSLDRQTPDQAYFTRLPQIAAARTREMLPLTKPETLFRQTEPALSQRGWGRHRGMPAAL